MEQTESKIITATITNITFQNPVTGWCVVQTEAVRKDGTVAPLTMKGVMPGIAKGKKYEFTGTIEKNKYGTALNVSSLIERRPSDKEGIYKYLASGLIKKIGPVLARSIVDTFGDDTLDVLDNEPERRMEVPNIGKKRVQNIIEAVKSQRAIRAIMVWLKRYDITNGLATKIYKTWGDDSVARLEENPYRLADDIKGVGFKKADDVALKLGLPEDSEFRIASAIKAALEDAAEAIGCEGIAVDKDVAKVSVVGAGLMNSPGMAVKMFEALAASGINIQMISSSEIKLSAVIDQADADRAVLAVHEKYFGEG